MRAYSNNSTFHKSFHFATVSLQFRIVERYFICCTCSLMETSAQKPGFNSWKKYMISKLYCKKIERTF